MHKLTRAEKAKKVLDDLEAKETKFRQSLATKKEAAKKVLADATHAENTRRFVLIGKYVMMQPKYRDMVPQMFEDAYENGLVIDYDVPFLKRLGDLS